MLFDRNGNITDIRENNEELSLESTSHIMEMVLLEELSGDELDEFLDDKDDVAEAINDEILTERTIVKLDKKAKLSKARKMAIFQVAKEKKDPKFKKLLFIWKMERFLEDFLEKKYGNEAMRRAKKAIAKPSKSKAITKAAERAKKQFNKDLTKSKSKSKK